MDKPMNWNLEQRHEQEAKKIKRANEFKHKGIGDICHVAR